jgi:hypothetical protein
MTSVANQPVGADSVSGSVKGGVKSANSNHAGFLGSGKAPQTLAPIATGTLGGSVGSGAGFPKASAPVLTSIEKPLPAGS